MWIYILLAHLNNRHVLRSTQISDDIGILVVSVLLYLQQLQGAVVVVIISELDLQLPMQSVSITINVASSNLVHGEVYPIQYYVIKFVSDIISLLFICLHSNVSAT
jgi:uncharacterized membrane protein